MLKGKIAIVTGGNAGIGKAIAMKYVQNGATVVIFGTNSDRGKEAVDEIKIQFPEATVDFVQVNVAESAPILEAVQKVLEKYGQVDILVNNAGITRDNLLMKMSEDDWNVVMDVNLKSLYNTCKALVRPMMRARRGKIINVSSVVGLTGNPGQINYAASKSGMFGFTKSLSREVAGRNVTVNCIAPGFVDTKMTGIIPDKTREGFLKQIPMGRFGKPEEIANAALFLASDMADYITGQIITVDGGLVMN